MQSIRASVRLYGARFKKLGIFMKLINLNLIRPIYYNNLILFFFIKMFVFKRAFKQYAARLPQPGLFDIAMVPPPPPPATIHVSSHKMF